MFLDGSLVVDVDSSDDEPLIEFMGKSGRGAKDDFSLTDSPSQTSSLSPNSSIHHNHHHPQQQQHRPRSKNDENIKLVLFLC